MEHSPLEARFREARDAFWNYDTHKATNLFRLLLNEPNSPVSRMDLKFMIVLSHRMDGDWESAARAFEELGLAKSYPTSAHYFRNLAGKPPLTMEFADGVTPQPVELARGQWILVNAKINGASGRFLLDTGCSTSVLTKHFADSLGIESLESKGRQIDANGHISTVPAYFIRELSVGQLTAKNFPIVTMRRYTLPGSGTKLDGVLGWDILQHTDLTIDFPNRALVIRKPSGIMNTEPSLEGRMAPAIRAISPMNQAMSLFLDTGYLDASGGFRYYDTLGSLNQLIDTSQTHRRWKPQFQLAVSSLRIRFPRQIRPAGFWFSGHSFVLSQASISKRSESAEIESVCYDGTVGNAPFTNGVLRLVATKRTATFEASNK